MRLAAAAMLPPDGLRRAARWRLTSRLRQQQLHLIAAALAAPHCLVPVTSSRPSARCSMACSVALKPRWMEDRLKNHCQYSTQTGLAVRVGSTASICGRGKNTVKTEQPRRLVCPHPQPRKACRRAATGSHEGALPKHSVPATANTPACRTWRMATAWEAVRQQATCTCLPYLLHLQEQARCSSQCERQKPMHRPHHANEASCTARIRSSPKRTGVLAAAGAH